MRARVVLTLTGPGLLWLWTALLLLPCFASPAAAALKKYEVRNSIIWFGTNTSPVLFRAPIRGLDGVARFGPAVIDDSVSPPVMRHLLLDIDRDGTVQVPGLSGFIFLSRKYTEGPADDSVGVSGDTSSQIAWGTLTGWFTTGRNWCNSEPATVCLIGGDPDEDTGPSRRPSPFYDIGTWIFHGTGFTTIPFIYTRFTTGGPGGNVQYELRGAFAPDGTVPALPLLGLSLLGGGLALTATAAIRRRR